MKVAGKSREAHWGIPSDAELWVWASPLESGRNHCIQMFAGVPLCFLFTSWEVSVLNVQVWSSVCVSQGDHGAVWQEPERAALPHLRHGSGGVPVFRWSCVRVGFTGLCPQVRELLQLSVRQHNRKQRNPGLGWVSAPHIIPPPRVAVRRPTSLKDSRTGLKLFRDLFFLSVSQTAATKMNSSLWCSPPPPLWTTLWLYSVGSSSTTLAPWWPASVQCECSIYTDKTYRGARLWRMCWLKQPKKQCLVAHIIKNCCNKCSSNFKHTWVLDPKGRQDFFLQIHRFLRSV